MATESLSWNLPVDGRIQEISDRLEGKDEFNEKDAPGLKDLLDKYLSPEDVKPEDFIRDLLKVFKDSETDGTYSEVLDKHTPEEQAQIEAFVAGEKLENIGEDFAIGPSLGCREELQKLNEAAEIVHVSPDGVTRLKVSTADVHESGFQMLEVNFKKLEQDVSAKFHATVKSLASGLAKREAAASLQSSPSLVVYHNALFQNWGLNVQYVPEFTCIPTTVMAIQEVVAFAKAKDMSVRCSGYRHSWSPIFGRKGQIVISMLGIKTATRLPNTASLPLPESKPTELESIEVVKGVPRVQGNSLVRVGCATTNERLRRWCIKNNQVTLPLNVIMVEITLGGSNAPICHGAGRRNKTLSDLVRKIEYIDANGKRQFVDKPEHLLAAGGCFGVMGVVTHITLEFSPMTYALLKPKKMPVICAVPPPVDLAEKDIPQALLKYWTKLAPAEKVQYQKDFERRASDDFYAEWFWFPYSDYSWVNTWNDTKDPTGVVDFPSKIRTALSWLQTVTMNILQNTPILGNLIELTNLSEAAVTLISRTAMYVLPETEVKTYLPDALHFQRAIQNVRVRDMEVEMPLVAKRENPAAINWQLVQRAWWDAILLVYANNKKCPMRMPLEMRIMGGSEIVMAPQRHNALGTCSIEVLTLHSAADLWQPFAQSVLDKWMALKDPATGAPLRTRPHWAKEWINFTVDGRPWVERLRKEYAEERAEFSRILTDIGSSANWTLPDLKARFSNELFDTFFFADVVATKLGAAPAIANVAKTSDVVVNVRPVTDVQ